MIPALGPFFIILSSLFPFLFSSLFISPPFLSSLPFFFLHVRSDTSILKHIIFSSYQACSEVNEVEVLSTPYKFSYISARNVDIILVCVCVMCIIILLSSFIAFTASFIVCPLNHIQCPFNQSLCMNETVICDGVVDCGFEGFVVDESPLICGEFDFVLCTYNTHTIVSFRRSDSACFA